MHETTSIANQTQSSPAALTNGVVPAYEASESETLTIEILPIQLKLSVGAPNDPLEYEADAMADKVMRMPESAFIQRCACNSRDDEHVRLKPMDHASSFIQRKSSCPCDDYDDDHVHLKPLVNQITPFIQAKGNDGATVSDSVSSRIRSTMGGGDTMQGGTKSFMENRFGTDFSNVKIHTGDESIQLSQELNAKAFTVSNNIYFNKGEYQPVTDSGKHLLAHELTHVVQQSQDIQMQIIQRDSKPATKVEKTDKYQFWIAPPKVMMPEEWVAYFELQIFHKRTHNTWNGKGIDADKLLTQNDVGKAIRISVDKSFFRKIMGIHEPGPDEPEEIYVTDDKTEQKVDAEVDRRFGDITHIPKDAKDGQGDWQQGLKSDLRKQLFDQLEYLSNISKQTRKIVDYKNYGYEDYEKLIGIYQKLSVLSPSELEDYLSKVNADTNDLAQIEQSIDRYLAEKQRREESTKRRETIKTKLFGLDTTFALYEIYKAAMREAINSTAVTIPSTDPSSGGDTFIDTSPPPMPILDVVDAEKNLLANLKINGFGSIQEFEQLLDDYEKELLIHAKEIAFDVLAKYEHFLFESEKKYNDQANMDALFVQLQPARANYSQGKQLESEAAQLSKDASDSTVQADGQRANEQHEQSGQKADAARTKYQQAKDILTQISATNPLLGSKDFKRESLLSAPDKSAVQKIILDYIHDRQKDISDTRDNINKDPLLMYKLDQLMDTVYQLENMRGSIYAKIIQFRNQERKFDQLEITQLTIVFTLALGLLTFVGGPIGIGAGLVSLGISTDQALDQLKKYNVESAAYGTQLLSEEPSLGWVIVSFIAAGIDLTAVSAATFKSIATVAKEFKNAEEASSALSKFKEGLDKIPGLDAKLKQALIRGAEAEAKLPGLTAKYDAALLEFQKLGGRVYSGIDPELVYRVSRLAYLRLKKGAVSFEVFYNELKAGNAITGIETADRIAALKQGFIEGLAEESRLAKIQKIGDRLPINAEDFAGKTFSFDLKNNPILQERLLAEKSGAALTEKQAELAELARKYPKGVKFTDAGFPDFKPYAVKLPNGKIGIIKFQTTGNRAKDFLAADKLAGITDEIRRTNGWVWHHVEDTKTMILVPKEIHNVVKHSGGIAVFLDSIAAEDDI